MRAPSPRLIYGAGSLGVMLAAVLFVMAATEWRAFWMPDNMGLDLAFLNQGFYRAVHEQGALRSTIVQEGHGNTATSGVWNTVEGNVGAIVPRNGNLTQLDVVLAAAPGGGQRAMLTANKNGSAMSATVTISGTATTGQWNGSVAISRGDRLSLTYTGSGGAANTYVFATAGMQYRSPRGIQTLMNIIGTPRQRRRVLQYPRVLRALQHRASP